jgi:hypothetical protein
MRWDFQEYIEFITEKLPENLFNNLI